MEKTALQKAISDIHDEINRLQANIINFNYSPSTKNMMRDKINVFYEALLLIEDKLPSEKEQMRKCYAIGEGDSKFDTKTRFDKGLHFETYYKETYGE